MRGSCWEPAFFTLCGRSLAGSRLQPAVAPEHLQSLLNRTRPTDHGHPPCSLGSTPSILPSRASLLCRPALLPGRAGTDLSEARAELARRARDSRNGRQDRAPGISIFLSVRCLSAAHPAREGEELIRACRRSAFGSRGEKCCLCAVAVAPRRRPVEACRLAIRPH